MNRRELLQIFALASEFREGDPLADNERDVQTCDEARRALSALRFSEIAKIVLVEDRLSEVLALSVHKLLSREIASLTVAAAKRFLLSSSAELWWRSYRDGLSSEMIAAIVKVMTDEELSAIAQKLFAPLPGPPPSPMSDTDIAVGSPQHFGSRIQANSPRDDEEEILFSILEGLSYGCGDVFLSISPANDDLENIARLEQLLMRIAQRLKLPSRVCVMTDLATQAAINRHTKLDAGFERLAGTSSAMNFDIDDLPEIACDFAAMQFETGRGIESAQRLDEGVDSGTLEARAFGLARHVRQQVEQRLRSPAWITVCSAIGRYDRRLFHSGQQILRACLESAVMAKLHGLTVGLEICPAFELGIAPITVQQLTAQIARQAAPAYLTATAGNVDPLSGALTTSFREHPQLRRANGKQITTAMRRRLDELGAINSTGESAAHALTTARLYTQYAQGGGDARSSESLQAEGLKKLEQLKQRGFDLGYGHIGDYTAPKEVERRLEAIYTQARRGLHAKLD